MKKFPFEDLEFYRMQKELAEAMVPLRARGLHLTSFQKNLMALSGAVMAIDNLSASFAATAQLIQDNFALSVKQAGEAIRNAVISELQDFRWSPSLSAKQALDDLGYVIVDPFEMFDSEAERKQFETAGLFYDFLMDHEFWVDRDRVANFCYWLDDRWTGLVMKLPVWLWEPFAAMKRAAMRAFMRGRNWFMDRLGIISPSKDINDFIEALQDGRAVWFAEWEEE